MEKDRENVSLIIRNIATLRYEDRAIVKLVDVYRFVRAFEPPADHPITVFLDPPYREFEKAPARLNQLIVHLVDHLPAGSVLALEAGRILDATILPELESWDIRRYGDTRIAIKTLSPHPESLPATFPPLAKGGPGGVEAARPPATSLAKGGLGGVEAARPPARSRGVSPSCEDEARWGGGRTTDAESGQADGAAESENPVISTQPDPTTQPQDNPDE